MSYNFQAFILEEILTGVHPSRHVRTVASNTRKFDSGILKALNRASSPSPSLDLSNAGKTELSTGHLKQRNIFLVCKVTSENLVVANFIYELVTSINNMCIVG